MDKRTSQSSDFSEVKLPDTQHTDAIEQLAEDSNWPLAVVAEMYWHELMQLKEGATVENFLGLLTARKVRDTLRHMPHRRAA